MAEKLETLFRIAGVVAAFGLVFLMFAMAVEFGRFSERELMCKAEAKAK